MRLHVIAALVAGVSLCAGSASADVRVTIQNGRVTVSAQDATMRQILTEWARVGQTRIVNLERVSGAPMTIELTNVPEAQALDTLLRSVSGYLAAPRPEPQPNASLYDRIFLMTGAVAVSAPVSVAPRPVPTAASGQPAFVQAPVFTPPEPQEDQEQVRPNVFTPFPQPPPQQEEQPAPPVESAPAGVSRPGMVVPAPPQADPNRGGSRR